MCVLFMKIDNEISFIGKCVLISLADDGKRILVIGDLHLGYEDSVNGFAGRVVFRQTVEDLKKIFERIGKVEEVVLLGDVKHAFGKIHSQEWGESRKFMQELNVNCQKIVVVKGNHDKILEPMADELGFELKDFYSVKSYGFFHGDDNFPDEIKESKIKTVFVGHMHPAVSLREDVKSERYKCFLVGKFRGKRIIVVPSFFPLVEGADLLSWESNLGFEFKKKVAEVYVVEGMDVLGFGKLGKLKVG